MSNTHPIAAHIDKLRAVLYARVSSKEQEEEGFSIPAQLKLLREYAQKNHLQIVEEFVDVETAKQAGRTAFGNMVHFLKESPSVKAILVEKTDRLYRNFRDYVAINDLDVEIHLVKEGEVHFSPVHVTGDVSVNDLPEPVLVTVQ